MQSTKRQTMRALVRTAYGPPEEVLTLVEEDTPTVGDDDVLVRVHASSVNPADWHTLTGTPYLIRPEMGFRQPKRRTFGLDVAGRVEAVGRNVRSCAPGDEVYGEVEGAYAEYVATGEQKLGPKPANLSYAEAAAVPVAALTALQGLRDHGRLVAGQRVLVVGASGGVGTFAVQIAKARGAEVTGVCSTDNVEMVRSIGADHVVDYTRDDFASTGRRYHLILDLVGNRSFADLRRIMEDDGIYVMVSGPKRRWLGPVLRMVTGKLRYAVGSQRFAWFVAKANRKDLVTLADLIEAGQVKPVIDATYDLANAAAALGRIGAGHGRGKTVLTIAADTTEV